MAASIEGSGRAPDIEAADRFLAVMAEGEPVTFQTFGEAKKGAKLNRILHGPLEEHSRQLGELNRAGAGVYWMVNFGDGKGRAAANVTGVRALFVDLDGAPLEPVLAAGLPPHAAIESSPGRWHAYWLVGECLPGRFKALQQALAKRFGGDEKVCDLPRVMRLPGFWHLKAEPFRSRIVGLEARQPYALEDLIEVLRLRTESPAVQASGRRAVAAPQAFAEGRRNAGLTQLAGGMRRRGMSQGAIEAALLAENLTRCIPPLDDAEVRTIAASVSRYAPGADIGDAGAKVVALPVEQTWPEPVLPGSIRVPEIPAELFPGWVGEMVDAVAKWAQVPVALPAMVALSVLAAVLQRRFEVAPYGDEHREPLAIWTLTALPSGSRKSAVINALAEPLVHWEKLERDRLRSEIARNHAMRQVAEKRIEKLTRDAAGAKTADERGLIQAEIQKEREALPAELIAPRIFTGDVTGERLQQLLVEHDERMTVLTDEGGIFGIMAGQYSGGNASLDVFLQGHSGSAMRVDRAGRFAHLDRPALSFGLAIQPGILAEVAKGARRFRDSGLLARFLYAIPKSNIGHRDVRARAVIPQGIRAAWSHNVHGLLADMVRPIGESRVLSFDPPALEQWLVFSEGVEANQGEGSRFEHMSDWTAKLAGAVARIAALFELAAAGTMARSVSGESMERAVRLARLLMRHGEGAFRLMGAVDAESDALAVLRWIEINRLQEFTRREAQKAMEGRFRVMDRLLAALRTLQDWAVIGPERMRRNERARPTAVYQVNPRFVGMSR